MTCKVAVSYTHLDVYKRQDQNYTRKYTWQDSINKDSSHVQLGSNTSAQHCFLEGAQLVFQSKSIHDYPKVFIQWFVDMLQGFRGKLYHCDGQSDLVL